MTQSDATQLVQILIFGGRGDLARRKLVPAIASLARRPQGARSCRSSASDGAE
ncbi:MAG: hypothetical protein IPH55_08040 [Betaproteobacteria bacterium]|nr:hypothetical protein [Betaproteobacteria bacterium]